MIYTNSCTKVSFDRDVLKNYRQKMIFNLNILKILKKYYDPLQKDQVNHKKQISELINNYDNSVKN